jgi:hypothetical protein
MYLEVYINNLFIIFPQTSFEEVRLDNFLSAAQEFGVKGLAEDIKELSDTLQHTPHHQAGLQIRIPLCRKIDRLRVL